MILQYRLDDTILTSLQSRGVQPRHGPLILLSQNLVRKPNLRLVTRIKHRKCRLERHATPDIHAQTRTALDPTIAALRSAGQRAIVDVLAGDVELSSPNGEGECRKSGRAGEGVAAAGAACGGGGTGDLAVVGRDDGRGQVDEGGARVGDAVDGGGGEVVVADGVAGGREGPVARVRVDGRVGDGAGVFGGVDEAKVVGALCLVEMAISGCR